MRKVIAVIIIMCITLCGCGKKDRDIEREKAFEEYKWVEESHKETMEVIENAEKRMEEVESDPFKYAAEHGNDKKYETDSEVYASVKVAIDISLRLHSDEIGITEETYVKATKNGVKTDNKVLASKLEDILGDLSKIKVQDEHSFKISPSSEGFTVSDE